MADPDLYRAKEEIERWKQRDPIPAFSARLSAEGALSPDDVVDIEARVARTIDEAVAFAESSEWEDVGDLLRFVTTD